MRLQDLEFRNFRNYSELRLPDLGDLVIFCGPNAIGKTNILEGIHLLTAASSFRHSQINQLIEQGQESSFLQGRLSDGNREITTTLYLEPGKKRFQINGKNKQTADVKGILPAVSFVPDDLNLAKKSSSVRRDALDDLGVQLSKNYNIVYRDYEKALRYKNRLLKDEAPQPLVDAINETLLAVASQLYCYRRSLYTRIVPIVQQNYAVLAQSGEKFNADYQPSWLRMQEKYPGLSSFDSSSALTVNRDEVRTYIYDALTCYSPEEARGRRSFIGPHNDQITFFLSDKDASIFASQGQQRSIVLAWKLAEVQMVRQTLGVNPVLLLDDVMSELDETRRDMLVNAVGDDIQTFITTTDLSPFRASLLEKANVIHLPLE
ncbi:MAG: DNA replication and repair protein RecF [Eggerthellaceae bacterium]|nr:DNA replication and repair protein RecF [Eggerthellaceae bacterium]